MMFSSELRSTLGGRRFKVKKTAVKRWWMSLGAAASITVALAGCGRPLGRL